MPTLPRAAPTDLIYLPSPPFPFFSLWNERYVRMSMPAILYMSCPLAMCTYAQLLFFMLTLDSLAHIYILLMIIIAGLVIIKPGWVVSGNDLTHLPHVLQRFLSRLL